MAYVPVPKDLSRIKPKILFGLTKRQLVCFGLGFLTGVPLFFWLKGLIGSSAASMCMIVAMIPFFLFAMYEKNGRPLERILRNILDVTVIRPAQRPYKTRNFYAELEKAAEEEKQIVSENKGKVLPSDRKAGRKVRTGKHRV